jgi:hypothetical protein
MNLNLNEIRQRINDLYAAVLMLQLQKIAAEAAAQETKQKGKKNAQH